MARRVKAARLGGAHEGHFERSRGQHGGIMRWPLGESRFVSLYGGNKLKISSLSEGKGIYCGYERRLFNSH